MQQWAQSLRIRRHPRSKNCDVYPGDGSSCQAATFLWASPEDEVGRKQTEGPQRRVTISKRFALGRFEVTIDQFSAFVAETGFATGNVCHVIEKFDGDREILEPATGVVPSTRLPRLRDRIPSCASADMRPKLTWPGSGGGPARPYQAAFGGRIGEYAARAGTTASYSFGMDETYALRLREVRRSRLSASVGAAGCRSDAIAYQTTLSRSECSSPIRGAFQTCTAMHGNGSRIAGPLMCEKFRTDRSAFTQPGGCEVGVVRGGCFSIFTKERKIGTPKSKHRWKALSNGRLSCRASARRAVTAAEVHSPWRVPRRCLLESEADTGALSRGCLLHPLKAYNPVLAGQCPLCSGSGQSHCRWNHQNRRWLLSPSPLQHAQPVIEANLLDQLLAKLPLAHSRHKIWEASGPTRSQLKSWLRRSLTRGRRRLLRDVQSNTRCDQRWYRAPYRGPAGHLRAGS